MIAANWTAPSNINTVTTTRDGGHGVSPYLSNNIALHVGDDPANVKRNRATLCQVLPSEPLWLEQTHSTIIIDGDKQYQSVPVGDGVITSTPNRVIGVMTADCLPLLICDQFGNQVAAVHAGWKGLADGIIENCIAKFISSPQQLSVWLGPAISGQSFEVGQDVFDLFVDQRPSDASCFKEAISGRYEKKYLADLYALAKARLIALGVKDISGGNYCTFNQADLFFSYRRDGVTGRMISLIWIGS